MATSFNPTFTDFIDDFDAFVRYLDSKPNLLLTTAGDLKAADLWAVNDRVNYKAPDYVTARSRQIDYPLLGFLFQIATASRLFLVQFGKTTILAANKSRIDQYRNLTLDEKYIFLLETAWCYADWSAIDGDGRSGVGANWFQGGIRQLLQNPVGAVVTFYERGGSMETNPAVIHVSSSASAYIRAGYWFGWYTVREVVRTKRDKYELDIDQVILTEWGQQCLTVLLRDRPFQRWNKQAGSYAFLDEQEVEEERVSVNSFADVFRVLLDEPDLLSLYPVNPNPPTGTYWFRVELPKFKASRTLVIPVDWTLEDLHILIQRAFDFDNDHLYTFFMNPRNPYNGEQYYDPRMDDGWADGYPADSAILADLTLYEGQPFLYIFDFGDRWAFNITVVQHRFDDPSTQARVEEVVGKAPAQYGDNE